MYVLTCFLGLPLPLLGAEASRGGCNLKKVISMFTVITFSTLECSKNLNNHTAYLFWSWTFCSLAHWHPTPRRCLSLEMLPVTRTWTFGLSKGLRSIPECGFWKAQSLQLPIWCALYTVKALSSNPIPHPPNKTNKQTKNNNLQQSHYFDTSV